MKHLKTALVVIMITATAPYTWGAVGTVEDHGVRYHAIQTSAQFLAAASGKEVTILAYEEDDELILEVKVDAKCIAFRLLQGWLTGDFETLLLREDIVRTLLRECLMI